MYELILINVKTQETRSFWATGIPQVTSKAWTTGLNPEEWEVLSLEYVD
jgi:hypothetical protein